MALDVKGSSSLFWKTGISTQGLTSGVNRAKGILAGFAKNISAMDIFAGLAISAALAFKKIATQAYQFSREFEHAMTEVKTISDSVRANFAGMSKQIMDMSREVPESATGLTKALYQVVSAGYDGAEAMDILKTSAKLAVATVTDTKTAADALTSVMNAYGDAAGSATSIADKFAQVIKNAKTTMEELGPEITTVTGLAAQAGMAFDDLMAIIATGAKTLKTPEMMTGIRGILTGLLKPSEEAITLTRQLGIDFSTAALKAKGYHAFLAEVLEKTEGNAEALAALFPNIRGLTGFLATATKGGEEFAKQLGNIQNATGSVGEWFEIMVDTTENQMALLSNNITAKLKPLGDNMLEFFNGIAKRINRSFLSANEALSSSMGELIGVLSQRKSMIEGYVSVLEELGDKISLTADESVRLQGAESALSVLLPDVAEALRRNASATDILAAARRGLNTATQEMLDLEREQAELNVLTAQQALDRYEIEKAPAQRALQRRRKQLVRLIQTKYQEERGYKPGTGMPDITGGVTKEMVLPIKPAEEWLEMDITGFDPARRAEIEKARSRLAVEENEVAILQRQLELAVKQAKQRLEYLKSGKPAAAIEDKKKGQEEKKIISIDPDEMAAREEMLARWVAANRTAEEKILDIQTRYAQMRSVATDGETKDRLDAAEAIEIEMVQLMEERNRLLLTGTQEELSTFVDMMHEKAEAEKENLERREALLKIAADAERLIQDDLFQDYRRMNDEQLTDYEATLRERLKAAKGNAELEGAIYRLLGDVMQEIWQRAARKIQEISKALGGMADLIGEFDAELGKIARSAADLAGSIGDIALGMATGDIGQTAAGLFSAVKSVANIAYTIQDHFSRATVSMGKALTKLMDDLGDSFKDAIDRIVEKITGISWDSLTDAVVEAFKKGETGVRDVANLFEDLMKTALINAFKVQLEQKLLAQWFEVFTGMLEGGLTEAELKLLKKGFSIAMKDAQEAWEAFREIAESAGIDLMGRDKQGLAGAIKGITEDTAGLIAGQFNALMINTVEINRGVSAVNFSASAMAGSLEQIVMLNARIAENTSANPYILQQVTELNDKFEPESTWIRSQGG